MKALRLLAWLQGDAGDSREAAATVLTALDMAREAGDLTAECACWNSIGAYVHQAGRSAEAIGYFLRAIELAEDAPDRRVYRDIANSNVALAALDIGDLKRAMKAAEAGVSEQQEPRDAVEADQRAMREGMFARVLICARQLERARQHLDMARSYASLAGTERAKLNVEVTLAAWEISAGDITAGLGRTKRALAEARSRSKGQLPAILAAVVGHYEAAGRPDVALKLLRELSAINKRLQGEQLLNQLERDRSIEIERSLVQDSDLLNERERSLTKKIEQTQRVLADAAVSAALACGLDARRPFRVAKLVEMFASHQGLPEDQIRSAKIAGLLADIGMLSVASAILLKREPLTRAERVLLNDHARHGAELVEQVGLEEHQVAVEFIRLHHERWDGRGPHGLAGEEIPIEVRIVSLCDTLEAMTHDRPWRLALSIPAAVQDITSLSGEYFDPLLAASFVDWLRSEYWKHRDFDAVLGEEAGLNDVVRAKEQIARYMGKSPGGRRTWTN
jgi:HD-GYP domain-containing protein (c-di-GMP phosphodiesterase class II)